MFERTIVLRKIGFTPSGSHSTFQALSYWYIACRASELKGKPKRILLWDTPIVLFRDGDGIARALLDRCPHRNVPLSLGRVVDGNIECRYHGWQFDGSGVCRRIPADGEKCEAYGPDARSFPVLERQGYIWIYTDPDSQPNHQPYTYEYLDHPDFISLRFEYDFKSTIFSVAENILDVPHTSFLHAGLFRGGKPKKVSWLLRGFSDRLVCEFLDEARPSGIFGKLIAPRGGEVRHYDRFILPGIAQVDYRLGETGQITTTSCLSPISEFETRMYTVATIRKSSLFFLIRPVMEPIVLKIVKQDAHILEKQLENTRQFGGERFTFHRGDIMGASIARMLKKAVEKRLPLYSENPEAESESESSGSVHF